LRTLIPTPRPRHPSRRYMRPRPATPGMRPGASRSWISMRLVSAGRAVTILPEGWFCAGRR